MKGIWVDGRYDYTRNSYFSWFFSMADLLKESAVAREIEAAEDSPAVWGTATMPKGVFEGELKAGYPHGRGVFTFHNGDRFEGFLMLGKLSGKGILYYANGAVYEGEFVNWLREGPGTYVDEHGIRYEGGWWKGKPDGEGTLTLPDGRSCAAHNGRAADRQIAKAIEELRK